MKTVGLLCQKKYKIDIYIKIKQLIFDNKKIIIKNKKNNNKKKRRNFIIIYKLRDNPS